MASLMGCGCGSPHEERRSTGAPAVLSRRHVLAGGLVAASTATVATGFATRAAAITADPSGRVRGSASRARTLLPPPPIVARSQWGADERLRTDSPLYDPVIDKLIVHHTVTPTNPSDPAYWVNQIYGYERANGYIDIAYHWLIDQYGKVYEGRWSRDRRAGEVVDGEDALGRNVRGAATLSHNSRTIAVAMLGDFSYQLPTPPAMEALATVLAWKAARWGLVPTARSWYRKADGTSNLLPNIAGHRQCSATACPGTPLFLQLPTLSTRVDQKIQAGGQGGFWVARRDGTVDARGDATPTARRPGATLRKVGGAVPVPKAHGLWLFGPDGGVFAFGDARFYGSAFGRRLRAPIAAMAATPTAHGYWLAGADGGVFTFGDARFSGSLASRDLGAPVVAMAATPTGDGYWLAAADGGVFAFGDARFHGAATATPLRAPVVAMAATPTGDGYWLAAADGGIFTFGAARYFGSAARRAHRPVVDMLATQRGDGYALLTDDGAVLNFGAAPDLAARDVARATGAIALAGRLGPARD